MSDRPFRALWQGMPSTLADRVLAPYTLRDGVLTDDALITDYAFDNLPETARSLNGEMQVELRFFATDDEDLTYSAIIQLWPVNGCGLAAMTVDVTSGALTTAAHPSGAGAADTYYEADTLDVGTSDLVSYTKRSVADGSATLVIDVRGYAWINAEIADIGGGGSEAVSAVITARAV
jgi:hypothetical protein